MSKLTLSNLGSGYRSTQLLDSNFDDIEAAFENTLSRDGTGPNQMEAPLDMNSNRITNLSDPVDPTDAASKGYLDDIELAVETAAEAAAEAAAITATHLAGATAAALSAASSAAAIDNLVLPYIDPINYGAVGDGTTDDTTALIAASVASNTIGKPLCGFGRTYKITAPVAFALKAQDFVIDMSAVTTTAGVTGYTNRFGLLVTGTDIWAGTHPTVALTVAAIRGDQTVTVADSSSFATGDHILLHESAFWGADAGGAKKSEHLVVKSVAAGTVTFSNPVEGTYTTAATLRKYGTEDVDLQNIRVIGSGAGGQHCGIGIINARHVYIDNVGGDKTEKKGVDVVNCFSLRGGTVFGLLCNMAGFGYALAIGGTSNVNVGRVTGIVCRHTVTMGSGISGQQLSRHLTFGTILGYGLTDAIFDSHPGAVDVQVGSVIGTCDFTSTSSGDGMIFQGSRLQVDQVSIEGYKRHGLVLQPYGDGDGIEPWIIIDKLRLHSKATAQYSFTYDDAPTNAGVAPLGLLQINQVDCQSGRGANIVLSKNLLRKVVIGPGKIEALGTGSGHGIRFTTAASCPIDSILFTGTRLKATQTASIHCCYFSGHASGPIRKARLIGCETEGGQYGIRADNVTVVVSDLDVITPLVDKVFVGSGGAVQFLGADGTQVVSTDANFTLTPSTDKINVIHTGTLTANRTVTLSTTGVYDGAAFRVTRTGGGAFNLNVGTGPLKAMTTNTWADFVYDATGAAWKLAAYGAL